MIDFTRLFQYNLIPFKNNPSRPNWVITNCPYCRPTDTKFHGAFNSSGVFNCWKCGGKSGVDALSNLMNISYREAKQLTQEYSGSIQHLKLNKREFKSSIKYVQREFSRKDKKYLIDRDFDPKELYEKYKLSSGGIAGSYKFRIKIPLIVGGRIISFTARDITGKSKERYMTMPLDQSAGDPKRLLYNMDNSKRPEVIVAEGAFDVIRLGDNTVCSFGMSMTEAQISLLVKNYKRVFFVFDPEPQAQEKAKKYAEMVSAMGCQAEVIDTELDVDPGDMTPQQVKELKKELRL